MIRLLRYLLGSVRFRAEGAYARRFLYDCICAGHPLWDMTEENGAYSARVRASGYRACAALARRRGVRLRIIQKRGLPFVRHRYRRRFGLIVGFCAFFVCLWVLSGYVWNIEISGNQTLTESAILDALARQGVRIGMSADALDVYTVSSRLFVELDELSWVFINRRGTTLYVEVRERVNKPEMVSQYGPANVVAAYPAKILRVDTYYGQAKVRPGDTVTEGELLVSGVWTDREGDWKLVRADAVVWAEARVAEQVRVEYAQTRVTVSPEPTVRYELGIFGWTLPLYRSLPEAEDVRERIFPLTLFGRELPLFLRRVEYRAVREEPVLLTREEAEAEAEARLAALEAERFADGVITGRKTAVLDDPEGLTLTAVYTAELNIARQEAITLRPNAP